MLYVRYTVNTITCICTLFQIIRPILFKECTSMVGADQFHLSCLVSCVLCPEFLRCFIPTSVSGNMPRVGFKPAFLAFSSYRAPCNRPTRLGRFYCIYNVHNTNNITFNYLSEFYCCFLYTTFVCLGCRSWQ